MTDDNAEIENRILAARVATDSRQVVPPDVEVDAVTIAESILQADADEIGQMAPADLRRLAGAYLELVNSSVAARGDG
jgi:hypothetical protein